MGVDEGNLLVIVIVMGVERYIFTSGSHGVEIKIEL